MDHGQKQPKRHHTKEFKLDALKLAKLKGVAQAARELGIKDSLIYNWRKQFAKDGEDSFPGKGNLKPTDERLRELERENKRLAEENDILKKAAIYFANQKK
jgi:transposase